MSTSLGAPTALAALLGVGAGLGLFLMIIGWRGVDPDRPGRRWRRPPGTSSRHGTVRVAVAVAVAVLTGVATGWVVGAILAGLGCWSLPRLLGRDPTSARRIARIEAVASWTEMLRDTLSAAAGLEQAILATAPLAPTAIRGEITDLAARLENGERLAPALRRLADQLADPIGDLVIAVLVLAAEQHARQLGELLGSLATAARAQAAMRMHVTASRARTRTSVRVIVATTLGFAVAVVLLNRGYLAAYDTLTGQLVLAGIAALFTTGFAWLARIATITEPTRLLTLPEPATPESAPSGGTR